MKNVLILFSLLAISLTSCIQDDIVEDFVEPTIRITTTPDTILVGSQFQFEHTYLNNVGQPENISPTWTSSDTSLLTINTKGLADAHMLGTVTVTAAYTADNIDVSESFEVNIGDVFVEQPTGRSGVISTTSSYKLEGDFTIEEIDGQLTIQIDENYEASTALPGLYVYLTNNPNTTSGAFEIGKVQVFEGAHSYEIDGIGINEYSHILYFCKPFDVKVGDGKIQ